MELTINYSWNDLTLSYIINNTNYTVTETDGVFVIPANLYTYLQTNSIAITATSTNNDSKTFTMVYNISAPGTFDLDDVEDSGSVTIGEKEALVSTVFVSKDNLRTIYNIIKNDIKNYTYAKNQVYQKSETLGTTAINTALSGKADTSSVYNKSEISNLLSDYYTKSEVDALLQQTAQNLDLSNYYTKNEIAELLTDIENDSY